MSNHDGSYILNEVLEAFVEMKIDEKIGKEATLEFVKRIIQIGDDHDGNPGEVLDGLERLGLCYSCLRESATLHSGLCPDCNS